MGNAQADAASLSRLRDYPRAFRMAVANVIDGLGTYIGLAALIVVGYHSSRLLGTAMVLAANVLPGLFVTLFVAPRLQHRQRRPVLLMLNFVGGVALLPAIVAPSAVTAIFAAAMLGAAGVATRGVQMAALAEAVPRAVRGKFYGMVGSFGQAVQVVGLAGGGAIAATLSPRIALAIDALSFGVAGLVIASIRFARVDPQLSAGISGSVFGSAPRVVWSIPLLRMLACVTWIGALVGTVPETASPAVTSTKLLPLVLAASPAGGALAALIGTRMGVFGRVVDTLRLALVSAISLVVVGAGMYVAFQHPIDSPSRALYGVVSNVLIGGLGVWFLGMMAAFAEHTPQSDTVTVGTFMSWSVGAASGLGGFVVAFLGVAGGYAALGLLLVPASLWGLRMVSRSPVSVNHGGIENQA
ncbi:MAG TPA: MFS transporter [Pedococcus sp.]|jgi:MFS family permease|nr:MFS transporter [Pedococcus sp.]